MTTIIFLISSQTEIIKTMDILGIATLLRYIIIGLAVLGGIVILVGLVKSELELIKRGTYLIVIAIVAYICSYFIVQKTEQRINDYYIMPENYEEQYNGFE